MMIRGLAKRRHKTKTKERNRYQLEKSQLLLLLQNPPPSAFLHFDQKWDLREGEELLAFLEDLLNVYDDLMP
jgi:hypothetical protein